jgi:hypothetical protein
MKIYTGIGGKCKDGKGCNLDECKSPKKCKLFLIKKYGLGIMISSSATRKPNKDLREFSCALDNGAFACFRKGYPFMEKVFLDTLDASYKAGLKLDFIVCPDIVQGGKESLEFSLKWATGRLVTCPNLALVVQDGMEIKDLDCSVMSKFSHLFVGGSVAWKWKTAHEWILHASSYGMKCHIGQCGQLKYLNKAKNLSASSVDSTSFVVNSSWHILDEFNQDDTLFNKAAKREADDAIATLKMVHTKLKEELKISDKIISNLDKK